MVIVCTHRYCLPGRYCLLGRYCFPSVLIRYRYCLALSEVRLELLIVLDYDSA